ncbi:hypothetical protein PR048_029299 [Dryococelus australis]|uniref:HTH psq-type domain-containing protein n=1 Tax=Dryococelus australis TaxID=614101 RepID=A0ABQ9GD05_9NEOP|nr:hypothetical protein PR048_029299 [Dryococelus australis]
MPGVNSKHPHCERKATRGGWQEQDMLSAARKYNVPKSTLDRRRKKPFGALTSAGRGKNVTVIYAVNACGNFAPPDFIFARKREKFDLIVGAPEGLVLLAGTTGSRWLYKKQTAGLHLKEETPARRNEITEQSAENCDHPLGLHVLPTPTEISDSNPRVIDSSKKVSLTIEDICPLPAADAKSDVLPSTSAGNPQNGENHSRKSRKLATSKQEEWHYLPYSKYKEDWLMCDECKDWAHGMSQLRNHCVPSCETLKCKSFADARRIASRPRLMDVRSMKGISMPPYRELLLVLAYATRLKPSNLLPGIFLSNRLLEVARFRLHYFLSSSASFIQLQVQNCISFRPHSFIVLSENLDDAPFLVLKCEVLFIRLTFASVHELFPLTRIISAASVEFRGQTMKVRRSRNSIVRGAKKGKTLSEIQKLWEEVFRPLKVLYKDFKIKQCSPARKETAVRRSYHTGNRADHSGGGMVVIWWSMSASGVAGPVCIEGNMDRFSYLQIHKDNLKKKSAEKLGIADDCLFQHDNDPKHSAEIARLLDSTVLCISEPQLSVCKVPHRCVASYTLRPGGSGFGACFLAGLSLTQSSNEHSLLNNQVGLLEERGVTPGFSQVGIVPDDAAGRRVFSGISRFPRPFIPAEEYATGMQVDLKQGFQKCSVYCEQPILMSNEKSRSLTTLLRFLFLTVEATLGKVRMPAAQKQFFVLKLSFFPHTQLSKPVCSGENTIFAVTLNLNPQVNYETTSRRSAGIEERLHDSLSRHDSLYLYTSCAFSFASWSFLRDLHLAATQPVLVRRYPKIDRCYFTFPACKIRVFCNDTVSDANHGKRKILRVQSPTELLLTCMHRVVSVKYISLIQRDATACGVFSVTGKGNRSSGRIQELCMHTPVTALIHLQTRFRSHGIYIAFCRVPLPYLGRFHGSQICVGRPTGQGSLLVRLSCDVIVAGLILDCRGLGPARYIKSFARSNLTSARTHAYTCATATFVPREHNSALGKIREALKGILT